MPAVIDCNRKLDVTATINRRTFQLNKRNHTIVRRDKRNLEKAGVIALESAGSLAGGERKRTLGRSRKQKAEGSRRNKADLPTADCLLPTASSTRGFAFAQPGLITFRPVGAGHRSGPC